MFLTCSRNIHALQRNRFWVFVFVFVLNDLKKESSSSARLDESNSACGDGLSRCTGPWASHPTAPCQLVTKAEMEVNKALEAPTVPKLDTISAASGEVRPHPQRRHALSEGKMTNAPGLDRSPPLRVVARNTCFNQLSTAPRQKACTQKSKNGSSELD